MLIWYGAGAVAAIVIAWLASLIHVSGHAPVGLVSVAVGISLGAALTGIAASLRLAGFRRLLVGAAILAILTVVAEHTWLYLDFRRQWQAERAKSAAVAMFRPESPPLPAEYFSQEGTPRQLTFWCLDAAIITLGSVGTLFVLRRMPQ
jgi:hypothetical protein